MSIGVIFLKFVMLIYTKNDGVLAIKHIIVSFFVVSSPFLLTTNAPVSPKSSEKNNRCLISERLY